MDNIIKFPEENVKEVKEDNGMTMSYLKQENEHLRGLLLSHMEDNLHLMEMVLKAQELLDRRNDG